MGKNKKQLGCLGEQVAADFLIAQGWQLVDTNVRNRYGEIDLLMRRRDKQLVFMEVKTVETDIHNRQFDYDPVDKLSQNKIHKLHKTITQYMYNKQEPWQLDAVVVYLDQDTARAHCRHFPHITNQW